MRQFHVKPRVKSHVFLGQLQVFKVWILAIKMKQHLNIIPGKAVLVETKSFQSLIIKYSSCVAVWSLSFQFIFIVIGCYQVKTWYTNIFCFLISHLWSINSQDDVFMNQVHVSNLKSTALREHENTVKTTPKEKSSQENYITFLVLDISELCGIYTALN